MKRLKRIFFIACGTFLAFLLTIVCINVSVVSSASTRILNAKQLSELDSDCILVLGCGVKKDGSPSDMLYDRVCVGTEVFLLGASDALLLSGDRTGESYDEVSAMKGLVVELGADEENILCDYEGYSTYESIARAKELFGVKKIIIVTQKYHLYRALYIADALGLEAYGATADLRSYRGQINRDVRELAARVKDFILVLGK